MSNSPISLIQWLKGDEYHETQAALTCFAGKVKIYQADVLTKAQAEHALRTWFRDSERNSQYCFIGAHGVLDATRAAIGIGASGKASEFVKWQELWNWFAEGHLVGGLWLGACKSSDAAVSLSAFLATSVQIAIPYIYGFSDSIYPPEIEKILKKLIAFTDPDNCLWLYEELAEMREVVKDTKIEMYYPAHTLSGTEEYVNVDEMPEKTGVTFRRLLKNQSSRRLK